jgi:hypothetical protein
MFTCAIIFSCLFQGYEMKIKPGVRITGLRPEMVLAATIADSVYKKYGQELVITSAIEGKHSKTSRHYLGFAIDTRTHYFTENEIPNVQRDLVESLGDDFYIQYEGNHFHIQFSPKTITG